MPEGSAGRSEHARRAASARWARVEDRGAEMAPARAGFLRRFMWEVDPLGELPYRERRRLGQQRRAEYMRELRER
jgi:hypothetical protein